MNETDSVDSRHYTIEGRKYVRVTSIVRFAFPDEFKAIPDDKRDYYFKRGTEIHRLAQMVEEGTADGFEFDPEVEKFRAGHAAFLRDTGFKALPGGIEMRVKNDELRYAGTLDRIGTMQGRVCIIDYKSNSLPKGGGLQTAFYLLALPAWKFEEVDRYCVALKRGGKYQMSEKYPIENKTDAIYWATKYHESKEAI